MNPAKHYAEAERLADAMQDVVEDAAAGRVAATQTDTDLRVGAAMMQLAQVHATLALAGVTFLTGHAGVYQTANNELADVVTGSGADAPVPFVLGAPNLTAEQRLEAAQQRLDAATDDYRDALDAMHGGRQ